MKSFKKIIGQVHLWLGLASGLVVFIVSITGCLYAFQEEIQNVTQPFRFVEVQNKPFLRPSALEKIALKTLPNKQLHAILYSGKSQSAQAIFYHYEPSYYYITYLNPYNGEVLEVKDMDSDFFRIVLMGHYYLWLPPTIGQPIVATSTLVFVVMLISGIILWWPKNESAAKQRFWFRWKNATKWKRKNYDLHNILGFYSAWIVLIIALTGLVWGFEWFANTVYGGLGGEKSTMYTEVFSDKKQKENLTKQSPAIDRIWYKMLAEQPLAKTIEVHIPESDSASLAVNVNMEEGTTWKIDYRYFDQYSLKELSVNHLYGRFPAAKFADKAIRMNYDIHVGAIFGLAGKVLAFLVSLVAASLPISGVLIWWGRRKKRT
ncbi:PepSY-associated TM helix domain-containing protein [Arcicella aquatica]|uniref:PepSY-associated TM helix domain-containing protein n=1 Tax=Arcicella aquatica TaxID=217141 RepID=A0ABU5QN29_9BACT|nr:PepSY-associated TM helix domain-containing protein [Arcicella aquatica]MEA5258144.1 PepSY-associated TM helix domain-containing protein [Arcicella aquatica]